MLHQFEAFVCYRKKASDVHKSIRLSRKTTYVFCLSYEKKQEILQNCSAQYVDGYIS